MEENKFLFIFRTALTRKTKVNFFFVFQTKKQEKRENITQD